MRLYRGLWFRPSSEPGQRGPDCDRRGRVPGPRRGSLCCVGMLPPLTEQGVHLLAACGGPGPGGLPVGFRPGSRALSPGSPCLRFLFDSINENEISIRGSPVRSHGWQRPLWTPAEKHRPGARPLPVRHLGDLLPLPVCEVRALCPTRRSPTPADKRIVQQAC